jgi:26S proteasome regulatory subunit T2
MGNNQMGGAPKMTDEEKKKARERRAEEQKRRQEAGPSRIGKKKIKKPENAHSKLPTINPVSKCRLRLLRQERIKDYLLME